MSRLVKTEGRLQAGAVFAATVWALTCGNGQSGLVEDARVVSIPAAPELPVAGGSYVDPTFGTTIRRVTDEGDGIRCETNYSYTTAFNADSTRFWVTCVVTTPWGQKNEPMLFDLDPATGSFSKTGPLFGNERLVPQMHWSATDPNVIYGVWADRLYRYDVVSGTRTELANLGAACAEPCYAWQLSKSADDRYFAAHMRSNSSYAPIQAVVWDRVEERLRTYDVGQGFTYFDESHLDKGGRWLMLKGKPEILFWDFHAGTTAPARRNISHYDTGNGFVAHEGGRSDGRPGLASTDPLDAGNDRDLFLFPPKDGKDNWLTALHLDVAPSGQRAYVGTYVSKRDDWFAGMDEIVEVWLDGSGKFRRLAHHRSRYVNYNGTPRGNVDPSGRWFLYTSNWDGSARTDVFLLRIPKG